MIKKAHGMLIGKKDNFMTLGVEGAGHHIFLRVPPSLVGMRTTPGGLEN